MTGVSQADLALVDELEHGHRDHGLGDAADPVGGVGIGRRAGLDVGHAGGSRPLTELVDAVGEERRRPRRPPRPGWPPARRHGPAAPAPPRHGGAFTRPRAPRLTRMRLTKYDASCSIVPRLPSPIGNCGAILGRPAGCVASGRHPELSGSASPRRRRTLVVTRRHAAGTGARARGPRPGCATRRGPGPGGWSSSRDHRGSARAPSWRRLRRLADDQRMLVARGAGR